MAEQPALRFAGLLRQLRGEARLTQEELAEAASLSPRAVSDLERGVNRTARKETAELLAGALGLAGTAHASFVAAARGRAPAADALAAIRGPAAEAPALTPARSTWEGCPYLGLMPFQEQDAKVFYGRGDLVAQLVRRLAERLGQAGILLVTGESGAGKSSLLRAGLMAQLASGALGPGSDRWPRRVIRPTASPLRGLAKELADVASTDTDSVYRSLAALPGETPTLVELAVRTATGRDASRAPADSAHTAADAPRLVLVVDQFEELFTAGEDTDASRAEREAFISALHAAATVPAGPRQLPPALVIAAVRADFLGRLIAYPPLKAALDAGPFTVGPMSEAELRLAMTGPAAEADLVVEPAVVDAVITELREGTWGRMGSGVLPLMSQAMAATWESREGTGLTLRAYRRAGGAADAVNRSAEVAYSSLGRQQQDAARLVFTQLTTITLDGQFERRRCSRAELRSLGVPVTDINTVIDVFSAQRLLVLGKDSVEISHDILLQAWKQLRDWLGDDQLDRALYGQVVTDAQTWETNGRDPSYLYRPGRLAAIDAAVTRWENAPTRYPPLPPAGRAFLSAAHHAARQNLRRRRSGFAALAILTVLAIVASGIAFQQRAGAVQQRDRAIYNQVVAEALQSGTSDTSLAARLDLAAYRINPTRDLASRLLDTENTPLPSTLAADAGFVNDVAFSPDGRTLASGNSDGTIRLWNVTDLAHPSPLGQPLSSGPGENSAGAPDSIMTMAFSPDGHTLASSDSNGAVRLWSVADPAHSRPFGQPLSGSSDQSINSLAFSPNGHVLVGGGVGGGSDTAGTLTLWNVADPAQPRSLGQTVIGTSNTAVFSVAISPDGRTVADGAYDGTLRLWNISDPTRPHRLGPSLTSSIATVQSVVFSPDGHTLASGDYVGTIRLWNVADPAHPQPLASDSTGGAAVESMAFSPDGHTLASGNLDGIIQLWNVADPAHPIPLDQPLTGGTRAVEAVAFSPDGRTLASGNLDGAIRLWTLPQTVLTGSATGLNLVAFSPDGRTLASGDHGTAIGMWDVADPARPQSLGLSLASRDGVASMAFSSDRHTLASGDYGGDIRIWDVADLARPRPLGPIAVGSGVITYSVAFSPDGHTLASGDSDDTVRLWDVADPARPRPIGPIMNGGTIAVLAVAFSPERHLLASGNADGTIRVWDVADSAHPKPLGEAQLGGAQLGGGSGVYSLAFSPDGRTLASGDYGGTIQLWNAAELTYLRPLGQPLIGGGAQVGSVAFSPDGTMMASGSFDGTTRLWNVAKPADPQPLGQPLTSGTVPVDSVAFSPDGHTLASGSDDGTTRLWNLDVQYAINRICATAGGLTPRQWDEYIPRLRYELSCAR